MGARAQGTVAGPGPRGNAAAGSQSAGPGSKPLADQGLVPTASAGLAALEPEPVKCTVLGQPVTELAVIIKPVAFLVTTTDGTFEVGRCWYQKGEFSVGVEMRRFGPLQIEHANYEPTSGLHIHLSRGYEMFIPYNQCSATWRR